MGPGVVPGSIVAPGPADAIPEVAEIPVAPGLGAGLRPAPLHAIRSGSSNSAANARRMPFIMRLTRNGPMGFRDPSRDAGPLLPVGGQPASRQGRREAHDPARVWL